MLLDDQYKKKWKLKTARYEYLLEDKKVEEPAQDKS